MTLRIPTLLALLLCVACSSPTLPIPTYLQAQSGCAILVGGDVGRRFNDKTGQELWRRINAAITNELFDRLTRDGYAVSKLLIPVGPAEQVETLVVNEAARQQCNRLLQIGHHGGQDAAGSFFRFDVQLMRFQPRGENARVAGGTRTVTVGEYQQSYRFAMSKEVFDNFYTGDFAQRVFDELKASGALKPLR